MTEADALLGLVHNGRDIPRTHSNPSSDHDSPEVSPVVGPGQCVVAAFGHSLLDVLIFWYYLYWPCCCECARVGLSCLFLHWRRHFTSPHS